MADDDLMERYLSDEAIDYKELAGALAKGIAAGSVFPVLCGSATKLIGIDRLAGSWPTRRPPRSAAADGPPAAFVFKTIADPYVGRVNVFKVMSGKVQPDAVLTNGRTVADERLHQLLTLRGREQEPAVRGPGRRHRRRGQAERHLDRRHPRPAGGRHHPSSRSSRRPRCCRSPSRPKSKADEDKLANALHRLQDEDPVLQGGAQRRDPPDAAVGHGRDPPLDRPREAPAQVRRRGRAGGREGRLPGDGQHQGRGRREVQEADRRSRPVRRRLPAGRTAGAGRRLRVLRRDRRRLHPPPVHPRRGEGASPTRSSTAAPSASRSSTSRSPATTGSTTRSTAPR